MIKFDTKNFQIAQSGHTVSNVYSGKEYKYIFFVKGKSVKANPHELRLMHVAVADGCVSTEIGIFLYSTLLPQLHEIHSLCESALSDYFGLRPTQKNFTKL